MRAKKKGVKSWEKPWKSSIYSYISLSLTPSLENPLTPRRGLNYVLQAENPFLAAFQVPEDTPEAPEKL